MQVEIRVFPRSTLSANEYKQLGQSIAAWVNAPSHFMRYCFEEHGLKEVLAGGNAPTLFLQELARIEASNLNEADRARYFPEKRDLNKHERQRIRDGLGVEGNLRCVQLTVVRKRPHRRNDIVNSLRQFVEAKFVDDIHLDGISWNESFEFDDRLYHGNSYRCHIVPTDDANENNLRKLGDDIEAMWNKAFHRVEGSWILTSGVAELKNGRIPDDVGMQFENEDGDVYAQQPTFDDAERRSVMFLVAKKMFGVDTVLRIVGKNVELTVIDSVIIDDEKFDTGRIESICK